MIYLHSARDMKYSLNEKQRDEGRAMIDREIEQPASYYTQERRDIISLEMGEEKSSSFQSSSFNFSFPYSKNREEPSNDSLRATVNLWSREYKLSR